MEKQASRLDQLELSWKFVSVARVFCALIEAHDEFTQFAFGRRVASNLASLYYAALMWPDIHHVEDYDDVDEMMAVTTKMQFARKLGHKFGEYDLYQTALVHYGDDPRLGYASLGDDLTDIYVDLKAGLRVLDDAAPNDDVINQIAASWRFGFETHWGRHVTSAMGALHTIIHDHRQMECNSG